MHFIFPGEQIAIYLIQIIIMYQLSLYYAINTGVVSIFIFSLNEWLKHQKSCPQCRESCTPRKTLRLYLEDANTTINMSSQLDQLSAQDLKVSKSVSFEKTIGFENTLDFHYIY